MDALKECLGQIPESAKQMAQHLATGGEWNQQHYIHRPCIDSALYQTLLQDSYSLLDDLGYDYVPSKDTNKSLIEYHLYQCRGKPVSSSFGWHQDDDGGVAGKVITLLYYLHKDKDIVGGDLLYSLGETDPCLENAIAVVTGKQPEYPRVVVETGKIVVLRGDVWHCPEDMSGMGERHLVVQIPRCD